MFFPGIPIDFNKYNVIDVIRVKTSEDGTLSRIFLNGAPCCYGFEPMDFLFAEQSFTVNQIKSFKVKTYNTKGLFCAIPCGVYDIDLHHKSSKWFNRSQYKVSGGFVPEVKNIPGYSGVCIHIGNTKKDTSGCLLVGNTYTSTSVLNSTKCFGELYTKLASFKCPIKIRYSNLYVR